MTCGGFPHSGTPGSKAVCASPGTIAACRALRRLPAPRHPPRAHSSLAFRLLGFPKKVMGASHIVLISRSQMRTWPPSWRRGSEFVSMLRIVLEFDSNLDETLCSCQGARAGEPSGPDAGTGGGGGGPRRRHNNEQRRHKNVREKFFHRIAHKNPPFASLSLPLYPTPTDNSIKKPKMR